MQFGDFEMVAGCGDLDASGDVMVVARPERVQIAPQGDSGENRIPGMIERVVYVGAVSQLMVRLASGQLVQAMVANQGTEPVPESGTPVSVGIAPAALRVLRAPEPAN